MLGLFAFKSNLKSGSCHELKEHFQGFQN